MAEDFRIQISYKTGPGDRNGVGVDMINLRANDPNELKAELDLVQQLAGQIAEVGQLVRAAGTVADAGIAAPNQQMGAEAQAHAAAYGFQQQAPAQQGFAPQQPAQQGFQGQPQGGQPAPAGGPSCAHGARVFKSGTSGKGPWAAWFCPLPKGTPGACDAQFVSVK